MISQPEGKCACIKKSSVGCPGSVRVPSGFSTAPYVATQEPSKKFLRVFISDMLSVFALNLLQSFSWEFLHNFAYSVFAFLYFIIRTLLTGCPLLFLYSFFNCFLASWCLSVHQGLFLSTIFVKVLGHAKSRACLLYTSPSPRD